MRCQVVLSGLDSREIVLPSINSYGSTTIDGLSNIFTRGGKWYAILDAHADDTYTKSFDSGESDAEIVLSDAGTEVHQFIFIDASIGVTEALAQAALAISCDVVSNDAEIDFGADYYAKEYNGGSSEFIVEVGRPTTAIRYMVRLYEHDDKTVGEMDDIALYGLSFVEIDD